VDILDPLQAFLFLFSINLYGSSFEPSELLVVPFFDALLKGGAGHKLFTRQF
jgi:hypothetical protein